MPESTDNDTTTTTFGADELDESTVEATDTQTDRDFAVPAQSDPAYVAPAPTDQPQVDYPDVISQITPEVKEEAVESATAEPLNEDSGVTEATATAYALSGADVEAVVASNGPAPFTSGPIPGLVTAPESMTEAEKAVAGFAGRTSFVAGQNQATNVPFVVNGKS